jgi:CelD/BcsL family acetyltransferase involved in cellulose biosynthesis
MSESAQSQEVVVTTVHDFDALQEHIGAWSRLACDAPQGLPILLPAWVCAFLQHKLAPNEKWMCSFAYEGERLVGVLPIILGPHPLLGKDWPVLRTPSDKHTPSADVLLAPDMPTASFSALIAELDRQVPKHLGLDLKGIRSNSPLWQALKGGFQGYYVRSGFRFEYSFLDVSGSFDLYLSGFQKMKANLKRFRKKLEQRGQVSVEIVRGSSAGVELLPEFLQLEASGWKGRTQTAILCNQHEEAFYSAFAAMLSAEGRLEWHLIRVDGRLVAAQFCYMCGRSLILDKYAFDEEFAECRPGTLLTELTFREAFARDDIAEVNPVSSASAHEVWHMPKDEYVNVHLVRRRTIPLLTQYPRVRMQSLYQDRLRPRIPAFVRQAYREFKRRGDRKPKRAAEIAQPTRQNAETKAALPP